MKKYVTLTKRVVITKSETDSTLKEIWQSAYKEVKTNYNNGMYRFPNDPSRTIRKEGIDFHASAGVGNLTAKIKRETYFTDCSQTIPIQIESGDFIFPIEVLNYDSSDSETFKIALIFNSIEYKLLDVIGNKLLLTELTGEIDQTNFSNTFFVELTDQILFKEYRIVEE